MMFDVPYELYEKQGYSSAVPVESTIPNLRRVRSRKVFSMTGDYKFALTYASASNLLSGTACTEAEIGNTTTSPCVSAVAIFKKTESEMKWTSIYCSIDPKYTELCDRLLKDIQISYRN